ncbi:MAG: DinB family protein [Bacillota bacterium]|nr:MAG: DinB family protein [Bacillota bacterium]
MDVRTLLGLWEGTRASTRKLAEAIPAGKEGFRPAEGAMPMAAHVLHIASADKTAIDAFTVTPGQWEWNTGIDLEHYPTVKDVVAILDQQTEATRKYLTGLKDVDLARKIKLPWGDQWTLEQFWAEWLIHEAHHRGSLITSLRVAGVEPPKVY